MTTIGPCSVVEVAVEAMVFFRGVVKLDVEAPMRSCFVAWRFEIMLFYIDQATLKCVRIVLFHAQGHLLFRVSCLYCYCPLEDVMAMFLFCMIVARVVCVCCFLFLFCTILRKHM